MKGNIYIPEKEIYRGTRFFNSFTTVTYNQLEDYMLTISEDKETIQQFNDLYDTVINKHNYTYREDIDITSVKGKSEIYE
ncbi:MAG: hypothetical protein P1P63_03790 [Treponemataceae bacterium]